MALVARAIGLEARPSGTSANSRGWRPPGHRAQGSGGPSGGGAFAVEQVDAAAAGTCWPRKLLRKMVWYSWLIRVCRKRIKHVFVVLVKVDILEVVNLTKMRNFRKVVSYKSGNECGRHF